MAVGEADCEQRDGGLLDQDVNAWTSLAGAVVGAVIVVMVLRRALPRAFLALGVLAAVEGMGSLLYHGTSGALAQYLHDAPLIAILGFVAGWHVTRLGRSADPGAGALLGLVSGLVAGLVAAAAGFTSVVTALLVAVVAGAEMLARRHRLRPVWTAPTVALAAVSAVVWLAGTAASPLCDERSLLQPHGAWHLLSALLLLAWVRSTVESSRTTGPPDGAGDDPWP